MAPETAATLNALFDVLLGFKHKAAVGDLICVDDAIHAESLLEKLIECLADDAMALSDDQIVAEAVRSFRSAEKAVEATNKTRVGVLNAIITSYRNQITTEREKTIHDCLRACRGAGNAVDAEERIKRLLPREAIHDPLAR